MVSVTTGTIKNKDTKKREPFLVIGHYRNASEFRNALREQFEVDTYDLRTVKIADSIQTPKNPTLISLEYLNEDLVG